MPDPRVRLERQELDHRLPLVMRWYKGSTIPPLSTEEIVWWEDTKADDAKIVMKRSGRTYIFESYRYQAASGFVPVERTITGGGGVLIDGVTGVAKDLSANRTIAVDQSYNFNWIGAHKWTPASAASVPITITANATQSANLLKVESNTHFQWVTINSLGLVGLSTTPDCLWTIQQRGLSDADVLALNPLLWYDAADVGGTDGTLVTTLIDKAKYGGTQRNIVDNGIIGGGMVWCNDVYDSSHKYRHSVKPASPTGAYLSHILVTGGSPFPGSYAFWGLTPVANLSMANNSWIVFAVIADSSSGGEFVVGSSAYVTSGYNAQYPGCCLKGEGDGGTQYAYFYPYDPVSGQVGQTPYWYGHVTPSSSVANWHIQWWRRDATHSVNPEYGVDGVSTILTHVNPDDGGFRVNGLNINGNSDQSTYHKGTNHIAEVIVFDLATYSSTTFDKVYSYLSSKYGIGTPSAGGSYDLFRGKDLAGVTQVVVDANYNLGLGVSTTPGARVDIVPTSASSIPLRVTGASSQSANLQEWRVSTPATKSYVAPDGSHYIGVAADSVTPLRLFCAAATPAVIVNTSTAICTGLNADLLDGLHASAFPKEAAVALTDAATIATDCSLGNVFTLTLGANSPYTLAPPTNATDGKKCVWRFRQDGTGGRTLSLSSAAGGFRFGSDVTAFVVASGIGKVSLMGAVYNGTDSKWDVVATAVGYN